MARTTEGTARMGTTVRKKAAALVFAIALATSLVPANAAFADGENTSTGGGFMV